MKSEKNVVVIGLGYVGCVSAACFAEIGHSVLGVDRDLNKVEAVRGAKSPFFEAGLDALIQRNVANGRLHAGVLDEEALDAADVAITTSFGASLLNRFTVVTDEVEQTMTAGHGTWR